MKYVYSLIITISFPIMAQDNLIQIDKSSYYKDSENIYYVVTNYLSNAPFFFLSKRSVIPLADKKNSGKWIDSIPFNGSGIVVALDEFEKLYRRSGTIYSPITRRFDTHSTFAIKLPGLTIQSLKNFKLLNEHYASIGSKVFTHYNELKGADVETFQLIVPNEYSDYIFYSKDKHSVFYYHHKIAGADVLSFEIINGIYAKDKNQIFFRGKVLDNADSKSFESLGGYQKDNGHVWFNGKLLDGVNAKTLKVFTITIPARNSYEKYTDYAIDKDFVYYQGNRVLKADPKSFKVILSKSMATYGINNTHIYSDGKIIKDADPKSFKE